MITYLGTKRGKNGESEKTSANVMSGRGAPGVVEGEVTGVNNRTWVWMGFQNIGGRERIEFREEFS